MNHRTPRTVTALASLLALLLAACGSGPSATGTPTATGSAPASAGTEATPGESLVEGIPAFMRAPFDGSYPVANLLDHDVPLEFVDSNGHAVAYWGEEMAFFDGHAGYDWLLPVGTPLLAAFDGTVEFAGVADPFDCPSLGRQVDDQVAIIITTTVPNFAHDQYAAYYAHGSQVDVAAGDHVTAGEQIGLSGNTGCSDQPHLHFQMYRDTHTGSGHRTTVDPYGWTGTGEDPWAADIQGAESVNLWLPNAAPELYFETSLAVNDGGSTAAFSITKVRWAGVDDAANPNNEFVEITLDPRYGGNSKELTGYSLANNAHTSFAFPAGFTLTALNPTVRVYSGSGTATATELYWGQSAPVWNDLGDCAQLVDPAGGRYQIITTDTPGCSS